MNDSEGSSTDSNAKSKSSGGANDVSAPTPNKNFPRSTFIVGALGLAVVLLVPATVVPLRKRQSSSKSAVENSAQASGPQTSMPSKSNNKQGIPTSSPLSPTKTSATLFPSAFPSSKVFAERTGAPQKTTQAPSFLHTNKPSFRTNLPASPGATDGVPTNYPTYAIDTSTPVTFLPGLLTVSMNGLLLSEGLTAKLIAQSGTPVSLADGGQSQELFHWQPDFGATFEDHSNPGGWIYVSNSENKNKSQGGVGAITFDSEGKVIGYKMVLNGTTANCGGGRTSWDSWISCEERSQGRIWEVDPTGNRTARMITLGSEGGYFESFAQDRARGHFYVTEDYKTGPVRRFTPSDPDWSDPWNVLHGNGTTEFLILEPTGDSSSNGTYQWTFDKDKAVETVEEVYPGGEGIDVQGDFLYFISKSKKTMFILNLNDDTYVAQNTKSGLFDGEPDQVQHLIGSNSDLLFFTEDEGEYAGVHARNGRNQFFTILEGQTWTRNTTGLAFSPNLKHMYVAFQNSGVLFDVTREDGYAFGGKVLNVRYHSN